MPFDPKLRHEFNPTEWWVWVCVMAIASASENRGRIPKECANNVVADTARISEECAEECLNKYLRLGLLRASKTTYVLVAWESRQFDSDVSTPRVKRYRERFKNAQCNAPESESDTEKQSPPTPREESRPNPAFADIHGAWEKVFAIPATTAQRKTLKTIAEVWTADDAEVAFTVAKEKADGDPARYALAILKTGGVSENHGKGKKPVREPLHPNLIKQGYWMDEHGYVWSP